MRFFLGTPEHYQECILEDGVLHYRQGTANRDQILAENAEIRKNKGAIKTMTFGKAAMRIPKADFKMLSKWFPGIENPAHPDYRWQINRLGNSSIGDIYRLEDRKSRAGR